MFLSIVTFINEAIFRYFKNCKGGNKVLIPDKQEGRFIKRFEDLTMMFYGEQGTGKTSFFSGEEDPLIIAIEPGSDNARGRIMPCNDWDTFCQIVMLVEKKKRESSKEISSVVIDIIDGAYSHCMNTVCTKLSITHPSDSAYGKGWNAVKKQWEGWLRFLYQAVPVRFITHEKIEAEDIKNDQGLIEKISKKTPQFSGTKAELLKGWVSLLGHCYINLDGKYCVDFGKSHIKETKDRTGILQDLGEIVLPSNTGISHKDKLDAFPYLENLYNNRAEQLGFTLLPSKRK